MSDQLTIDATLSPPPQGETVEGVAQVQPEPATAVHTVAETESTPVPDSTVSPSPVQPSEEVVEAKPEPKKRTARKPKTDDKAEAIEALEAQLEELRSSQEKSQKRMSKHEDAMREALLDRLGIRPKFRSYAPKVDPFTDKGKAALELWASESPELRDARPVPSPDFDVTKEVKSFSSPHLVSTEFWKDSVKSVRGGER